MVDRGPRRILEITSYPPPRAGWGVRVEFLKRHLEAAGHECVVLNIGKSRVVPSSEYETVLSGLDYVRKVWRFSRRGFTVHMHVNGDSPKGFALALLAEGINLLWGRRCFLTFHAGADQIYFPRPKYPLLLPMYKLLFGVPRTIICNSEAVKSKIVEYGVPPAKVMPIPAFSSQYLDFVRVPLPPYLAEFYRRFPQPLFAYIKIREGFYLDVLLEAFATLHGQDSRLGLVFCGVSGDIDRSLWLDVERRIAERHLESAICIVDDLEHDAFLTALSLSSLYIRTPTTDGVASSVLEALALQVPVIAAENGARPAGALTYHATDPDHLASVIQDALLRWDEIRRAIPSVEVRDTIQEEISALTKMRSRSYGDLNRRKEFEGP